MKEMKIFGFTIRCIVFYLLCNVYARSHVSKLMNGSLTDIFPKVAESIDFSVVYRLAKEIISLSKQNGTVGWSTSPNNTSIISKPKLNSLITRYKEEKYSSSPPIRSQNDRLFFLKTHKTGSSTISTILWRSLCLFSNQSDTNCFLPTKENSGRMWGEKYQKTLAHTTGTNGSFPPFEIWNAHIKVNFFEYLVEWSGLRGKVENSFSEFIFQKIIPRPNHFLSTIRRPSYRFESAFRWYELSPAAGIDLPISDKSQQPSQRELESSGLVQESAKENLFGKFLEFFQFRKKKSKTTKKKKNRLNSEKLGSSNVRSSNSALLLREFIEVIARKIVDRVESNPDLRPFSLDTLSLSSSDTNFIYKQIIDEILHEYEKKWKFRSGFHSMTKELIGQNQFSKDSPQMAFSQHRFEYYYSILLYFLLSSPYDSRLPKFLLIDIDNFQSSLTLLKQFISPFLMKNGLYSHHQNLLFYYFNQKIQNYQKLSDLLSPTVADKYYLFLDSLQYYDSFLYELNKELMDQRVDLQSPKFERESREFSEEVSVFQESCRSIQRNSNQTTVKSLVEEDDLKGMQSTLRSYLLQGKETLSKLSNIELQSLCKIYSLDNYDYVQLFHKLLNLKGKKTN
jgi:hypothetical protein